MQMSFKKVPITKRLYAFSIDVAVVTFLKVFLVQTLASYLNSVLLLYGKFSNPNHWQNEMTVFVFSLFPILWLGYSTLSTYISGSTLGTKIMGYHFEKIAGDHRDGITLLSALQRSALLLSCIYTFGAVALIGLLRKDNKVITDLVEHTVPILNNEPIENNVLTLPAPENENEKAA